MATMLTTKVVKRNPGKAVVVMAAAGRGIEGMMRQTAGASPFARRVARRRAA